MIKGRGRICPLLLSWVLQKWRIWENLNLAAPQPPSGSSPDHPHILLLHLHLHLAQHILVWCWRQQQSVDYFLLHNADTGQWLVLTWLQRGKLKSTKHRIIEPLHWFNCHVTLLCCDVRFDFLLADLPSSVCPPMGGFSGPRDLGTAVAASGQLVTYSRDCHPVLWLHVRKRATFYKLYCSTYRVTANKRKNHRPRLTWHVASSTNNWLDSFWFVVRYLFVMSPQTTDIGVKLLIRVHWSCTALLYILTVSEDVVYTNRIMSVSKNRFCKWAGYRGRGRQWYPPPDRGTAPVLWSWDWSQDPDPDRNTHLPLCRLIQGDTFFLGEFAFCKGWH